MYSLIIKYPDAHHIPTNSSSSTTSIIAAGAMQLKQKTLVEVINKIFNGQYEELFGENDFVMGQPESIVLTTDIIKTLENQPPQGMN